MQVPAVGGAGVLQAVAVKVVVALTVIATLFGVVMPDVPAPVHDQSRADRLRCNSP